MQTGENKKPLRNQRSIANLSWQYQNRVIIMTRKENRIMLDYQTSKIAYQEYERRLEHDLLARRFLRFKRQNNQRFVHILANFMNRTGDLLTAWGQQIQDRSTVASA